MCGIAGIARFGEADEGDRARIGTMAEVLRHRGPDDFGYLLANSTTGVAAAGQALTAPFAADILLASRRLSIIDLSDDGRQPVANESGDVFVVFNGAIHNYRELRAELEALGHTFRSQTDTEVIVHAYEAWGEACARRFNGMWAYAIWDAPRKKLVLSRDRFGAKPLYVAKHGGALFFASEIKAILAAGVPAVPNRAAVAAYLSRAQLDSGTRTFFVGIEPVPAAHTVVVTRNALRCQRYWSYRDRSQAYDYEDPVRTFRELFADAVRLRLRADVPTAAMVSGGLDSTLVAAFAAREAPNLRTFTASFPGFRADESGYASLVAQRLGLAWESVEYDPAHFVDDLADAAWHLDAPPRHNQVLPTTWLMRAIAREHKVVLEGEGSDELFAGYPRYLPPYVRDQALSLRPGNARAQSANIARVLYASKGRGLGTMPGWLPRLHRATEPGALAGPAVVDALAPAWQADERTLVRSVAEEPPARDRLSMALWRDHARRNLPDLLSYGDAIAMGQSVEVRCPFLDHRVVEFGFGLESAWKLRGNATKFLLREGFTTEIPPEILGRREKVGFRAPIGRWLKQSLADVREVLESPRTRERCFIAADGLDGLLGDFRAGNRPRSEALFRCLTLELWCRRFLDTP